MDRVIDIKVDRLSFALYDLYTLSSLSFRTGSVRVAERLAVPTSDHGVADSNPAGGEILPEPKRRFIAQSLSCSPFHRLEMTEILLKGCKTLTHPSIIQNWDTLIPKFTVKFSVYQYSLEFISI